MKRRNGIFQRVKEGPYYAIVAWRGRRFCESTRTTNRTEAKAFLDRMKVALRQGTYQTPRERRASADTVSGLAALWAKVYLPVSRNPKGVRLAKKRMEHYVLPFMGSMQLGRVTKDTVRQYRAHLEGMRDKEGERVLSDLTVKHLLSDLRCMFRWAEDSDRIERAPIPRRLMPKIPEALPRSLTAEEQSTVASLPDPYGFAVRVMLATGVRWSELCRLTSADVQAGELLVQGPTKSRKMRRVPLPPALLVELRVRVGKLVNFEAKDVSWFNRAVRTRSGVEGFSAHRCRHSFGFNYMSCGGNILALKEQMGHSTVELTAHYAKPTQELVREDAKRVEARRATA